VGPDELGVYVVPYEISGNCHGVVFVPVSIRNELLEVPGVGDLCERIMRCARYYPRTPGASLEFVVPRALAQGADALVAALLMDGPRTDPNFPEFHNPPTRLTSGVASTSNAGDPVDADLAKTVEALFVIWHSVKEPFNCALVYP
jgi:hypothetical protein